MVRNCCKTCENLVCVATTIDQLQHTEYLKPTFLDTFKWAIKPVFPETVTFIALDMTKLQRLKHKKLIEELKKRKQQGEVNLIIKNGTIVIRQPRRQPEILSEPIPPIKQPSLIDLADQCT